MAGWMLSTKDAQTLETKLKHSVANVPYSSVRSEFSTRSESRTS